MTPSLPYMGICLVSRYTYPDTLPVQPSTSPVLCHTGNIGGQDGATYLLCAACIINEAVYLSRPIHIFSTRCICWQSQQWLRIVLSALQYRKVFGDFQLMAIAISSGITHDTFLQG